MFTKILVPFLFVGAQFLITWYGNFTGKLPAKGTYLGIAYNSSFLRAIFTQFEYLWVLIIINILFTFGFKLGFGSYQNFLVLIFLWIASGPVAALLFNTLVAKESLNYILAIGVVLIFLGSFFVVGSKEILEFLKG